MGFGRATRPSAARTRLFRLIKTRRCAPRYFSAFLLPFLSLKLPPTEINDKQRKSTKKSKLGGG
jgi:hypothetical protein